MKKTRTWRIRMEDQDLQDHQTKELEDQKKRKGPRER
jgi:hypothetical protein